MYQGKISEHISEIHTHTKKKRQKAMQLKEREQVGMGGAKVRKVKGENDSIIF